MSACSIVLHDCFIRDPLPSIAMPIPPFAPTLPLHTYTILRERKKKPKKPSKMGFISSISRSVRNNKLSRKLSTSKPNRPRYEDSRDLIKIPSNTASLARVDSVASTIRHSNQEPVMPTESPTHRKKLTPADLNLQPLCENAEALDLATGRGVRAFSMHEYPILKMDTVQSPFDDPPRTLQDPFDGGEKVGKRNKGNGGLCKDAKCANVKEREENGKSDRRSSKDSGSKIKRSMTGLLKRSTSFKIPRSSLSLKTLRSNSPKWLDGAGTTEEDYLVDEKAEMKWLELNELSARDPELAAWQGGGFARLW